MAIKVDLKGKNAIVTGSTSGIGLGVARALAECGANVMVNGLGTESDNAKAIEEISSFGTKTAFSPANMLEPGEIDSLVQTTISDFGSVDILVNNAGIQFVSPIEEFPIDKWNAIIGINLSSAFHTIRCATPNMKQNGWGRIINIASAHSLVASPFKSAYVAAKHGIVGLTKTVALELAQCGVTCNAISPGYVKTPLVENQIPDTAKARGITEEEVIQNVLLAAQPTKEFITVEQVGGIATFLCSDTASQITGANMSVDGGWTSQ
ncbi:MAG: 3-hydroxybutyrate dehydrogenase [Methyloligellaceae bacterium]